MPSRIISASTIAGVREFLDQGKTHDEIRFLTGVGNGTISKIKRGLMPERPERLGEGESYNYSQQRQQQSQSQQPLTSFSAPLHSPSPPPSPTPTPPPQSDKKTGEFCWRSAIKHVQGMQDLKSKASFSQDYASITLGDGSSPVILMGFGDQHIGAYGANYQLFEEITDEIISTPNLYVALMGDYLEMAIKLRGVLEVTSQVLTPEMQEAFLESWLNDIKDKVAFATFDNHAVARQEQLAGTSNVKNMLARRFVYHNGIGHSDIKVGDQIYKCAASHKFRGGSMFNRMHAQGRYVRQEANDRELVLMADIHTWGFAATEDGGQERCYVTGGTLHENSGYAKRWFSLRSAPLFPCVVLHQDRHEIVPFKSVKQALTYLKGFEC